MMTEDAVGCGTAALCMLYLLQDYSNPATSYGVFIPADQPLN